MQNAESQGKLWNRAPEDWADYMEPQHRPLWEVMLDEGRVREGSCVLDAGCGGGGASIVAAERRARVSGIDAAAGMVAGRSLHDEVFFLFKFLDRNGEIQGLIGGKIGQSVKGRFLLRRERALGVLLKKGIFRFAKIVIFAHVYPLIVQFCFNRPDQQFRIGANDRRIVYQK